MRKYQRRSNCWRLQLTIHLYISIEAFDNKTLAMQISVLLSLVLLLFSNMCEVTAHCDHSLYNSFVIIVFVIVIISWFS